MRAISASENSAVDGCWRRAARTRAGTLSNKSMSVSFEIERHEPDRPMEPRHLLPPRRRHLAHLEREAFEDGVRE